MNLFVLLGNVEAKLETGEDPYFNEATELVTSILRTEEVLPYKRISLNGALHQLFSGIIVAAYEAETSIDVTSRHMATYHAYGFTTKAVGWLDKAVAKGLLLSPYEHKAKGALMIGPLLTTCRRLAGLTFMGRKPSIH